MKYVLLILLLFGLAACDSAPVETHTAGTDFSTTVPQQPTVQATKKPANHPTATPKGDEPTAVQATVAHQPTVLPQAPVKPTPVKTGVNGNPWGYDFSPGATILSPPADFCSYFACIPSFWKGQGYVVECQDGMYAKSGGRPGSCSHHGSEKAVLYVH